MAWPCISRVCCLARFWNQFDKSDLSVPLTIQNYSDISEQEVRSVTKHVSTPGNHLSSPEPRATGCPRDGTETHRPLRERREPSYKPREDYRPPGVPFPSVTQYKQDYKAWPIPRKENFPWIINGGSRAKGTSHSPGRSAQVRGPEREESGRAHRLGEPPGLEESKTSSYRQEYRPWTGARPAKSVRKPPPTQYSSPGTEASHVSRETSYQAAYSGEVSRSTGLHQGDQVIPSAAFSIQPTPVTQPIPNILQVGSSSSPASLQQSILPASWQTSAEEHLVRTKLPPNSSAVFQSGPRVFNV